MKKKYMEPVMWMEETQLPELLSGSGPGANDQDDPGLNSGSRESFWDDDYDEILWDE